MATTVSFEQMNVFGNKREDRMKVTIESGDTATDAIQTRLSWIEYADWYSADEDSSADGVVDPSTYVSPFRKTESTTEDDPGWLILSGVENPQETITLYIRAIGW